MNRKQIQALVAGATVAAIAAVIVPEKVIASSPTHTASGAGGTVERTYAIYTAVQNGIDGYCAGHIRHDFRPADAQNTPAEPPITAQLPQNTAQLPQNTAEQAHTPSQNTAKNRPEEPCGFCR